MVDLDQNRQANHNSKQKQKENAPLSANQIYSTLNLSLLSWRSEDEGAPIAWFTVRPASMRSPLPSLSFHSHFIRLLIIHEQTVLSSPHLTNQTPSRRRSCSTISLCLSVSLSPRHLALFLANVLF